MKIPLRLLMIEDSEDDAELIRLELERAGFELDWMVLAEEPQLDAALCEPWDIIVCDFQMPQFDGLRAFSLYKQREIDTPFIFVSGALGEDRAVEAMRAGARDYLLKGNLARLSVAVKRELTEAQNRAAKRRAQDAAEREQRRLAMAVEASGAGVFEHRIPPGPDSYRSERWAQILGYAPEEIPSFEHFHGWLLEQVHPDDAPMLRSIQEDFLEGRTDRIAYEFRVRHRLGHWVDVANFAKAVDREPGHRATHVVGVMIDLSERRKLEEQLRQAQKMEAVGRLAGGVAHDFNNLLTVIISFGNFVADSLHPADPAFEDMQEVLKAARRAATLTAQLLAFSRLKPVSPKVLNVNALVQEMDRMLHTIMGEDIQVSTSLSPDLCNVRMDSGSLEQVIVNLAVNARDAMPKGGRLSLTTDRVRLDASDELAIAVKARDGNYIAIAISDDGIGMDEATRRRIFEPFFTTKSPGKGTGLGLSMCYGIVEQAGGTIRVESAPGRGTRFEIYLPRVQGEVEAIEVTKPKSEDLHGTETILIAEDNEQVRRLAERALSSLGYRVIEASDGSDLLLKYEASTQRIDLLLADVVMPQVSGKQLADRLTPTHPDMKVLYMSGYTPNAILDRGVPENLAHMVQKPFTPQALAKKVREVLDR